MKENSLFCAWESSLLKEQEKQKKKKDFHRMEDINGILWGKIQSPIKKELEASSFLPPTRMLHTHPDHCCLVPTCS
jgi:hypothetical protein